MSTPPDEDELVEFVGDITDYWTYTQVRDWVLLHPEMTRTALHLYLLIRSMVTESARRSGGGLRRMSLDQLCWLLPGVNGKPASPTMVKDALRLLARHGLVLNPDEGRLVTSSGRSSIQNTYRRYQVNDLPPDTYTGWRNVWDKLDAYRPDWREHPPTPPTHVRTDAGVQQTSTDDPGRKSDHRNDQGRQDETPGRFDGRKSVPPGRKSVPPGRKSGATRALTSENTLPKEVSLTSSSLSGAPSSHATQGEREMGAAREGEQLAEVGVPGQRQDVPGESPAAAESGDQEQGHVQDEDEVLGAWAVGAGVPAGRPPATVRRQLAPQVAELVASYGLEAALVIAGYAGAQSWYDLGRAATAPACRRAVAAARAPKEGAEARRGVCPEAQCDGSGMVYAPDDPEGLRPYRCGACRPRQARTAHAYVG